MPIYAFVLAGVASFYDMPGARMANGQPFVGSQHICAMIAEPFGERVEIVNVDNHRTSWCIVSDRGPWIPGRIVDVSPAVRDELGFDGLASVRVYRTVGEIPKCPIVLTPSTCKAPPRECVLDLPKPALVTCSDGPSRRSGDRVR